MTSFSAFQATRRESTDLAEIGDCCVEGPGHVYLDGLYITDEAPAADGTPMFGLLLGRSEYLSANRAELEATLYEWAICEGYAEPTDEQRGILEEIDATEELMVALDGDERDTFAKLSGELSDLRAQLIAVNP